MKNDSSRVSVGASVWGGGFPPWLGLLSPAHLFDCLPCYTCVCSPSWKSSDSLNVEPDEFLGRSGTSEFGVFDVFLAGSCYFRVSFKLKGPSPLSGAQVANLWL